MTAFFTQSIDDQHDYGQGLIAAYESVPAHSTTQAGVLHDLLDERKPMERDAWTALIIDLLHHVHCVDERLMAKGASIPASERARLLPFLPFLIREGLGSVDSSFFPPDDKGENLRFLTSLLSHGHVRETHAILLDVGARVGLPESASYWFRKPSTPSPVGIDEINWRIIPPMGLVLGSGLEPETANLLIDALHAREDDNRAFVGVIPAPLNEFMRKMRAQESMKDSLPLLRTGIRVMAIAHTVRLDEEQEAMLADDWDMPDDFLTQRWKLENAPDPKKPYMWREMEAYLDAALSTDRLDWVVPPPWTEG